MESVAKGLYELGMEYRRAASETPGVIARSAVEHDAIVAALMRRDADCRRRGDAGASDLDQTAPTLEAMRRVEGIGNPGEETGG